MDDIDFMDEVEWVRGATGLRGTVVDCISVGGSMLFVVETVNGTFHEHEGNLRKVAGCM